MRLVRLTRLTRLAVGAALLLGTATFAAPSHARCVSEFGWVCTTAYTTCKKVEDTGLADPHCPYM